MRAKDNFICARYNFLIPARVSAIFSRFFLNFKGTYLGARDISGVGALNPGYFGPFLGGIESILGNRTVSLMLGRVPFFKNFTEY